MDHSIVAVLNTAAQVSPFTAGVTVCVAHYLSYLLLALFLLAVFRLYKGTRERLIFLFEAILAVFFSRAVFVELIRIFLHRPRPFAADPSIVPLLSESSYSFPSGHAAFFFALSTTVYLYNKKLGISFFIASICIGLGRVAAGVHYPTDILGGAVLGVVVGWGVHRYFKKHYRPSSPLLGKEGR